MKSLKIVSVLAAVLLIGMGCEKEPVVQPNENPQGNQLRVAMTDNPANFEELDVEIVRVSAYLEGEGWVELSNETQNIDVLTLTNGEEAQLAYEADVQAGHYSMIKIEFGDENSLRLNSMAALGMNLGGLDLGLGAVVDLRYEGQREVIVEIDEDVNESSSGEVLIDFDVMTSIRQTGDEYVMEPALRWIRDAQTGIRGEVEGAASAFVRLTNGTDTYTAYVNATGQFLLRGMSEGTYDLIAIPEETEDRPDPDPVTLNNVTVVRGEIRSVGQIRF